MNSIVAFCAKFTELSGTSKTQTFNVMPNPRIRAVLTPNYDPYLEAASSTMFRIPILKPVAARGSTAGQLNRIPVFHVHGYVPYEKNDKEPLVDTILTRTGYENAWHSPSGYSPTLGPQVHILRHYSTLFLGYSFKDSRINELLRILHEERQDRKYKAIHYAIIGDCSQGLLEFLEHELGVNPIILDGYWQIRWVLRHLYAAGLAHDLESDVCKLPDNASYNEKKEKRRQCNFSLTECYDILWACRNREVIKKHMPKDSDPNRNLRG